MSQRKAAGVFLRYSLNDVTVIDVEHTGPRRGEHRARLPGLRAGEVEYRTINQDGTLGAPVKTQF